MRDALKRAADFGGVFLVLAGLAAAPWYVDRLVENKLSEPETLRAIADQVRPSLVFEVSEGKPVVLVDQGAYRYLQEIRVEEPDSNNLPKKIIIGPKAPISPAPMLESLSEPGLVIEARPGPGIEWHFTIEPQGDFFAGTDRPRFRLEILRGTL